MDYSNATATMEKPSRERASLAVLVVDDHPLFRAGLLHLLNQLAVEVTIREAGNSGQALNLLAEQGPFDLVLVDLLMPGMKGFESLRQICQAAAETPVVVCSVKERADDVHHAMDAGSMGYIPKSSSPEVLVNALKLVLSGGVYLPPNLLATSGCN